MSLETNKLVFVKTVHTLNIFCLKIPSEDKQKNLHTFRQLYKLRPGVAGPSPPVCYLWLNDIWHIYIFFPLFLHYFYSILLLPKHTKIKDSHRNSLSYTAAYFDRFVVLVTITYTLSGIFVSKAYKIELR